MDTTNEPAINQRLEDVLNTVDALRQIIFDTGVSADIEAAAPVLFDAGETLFGSLAQSRDTIDQAKRALGASLLLQAVIKSPGTLDKAVARLRARVVAHLRPDLLRVFDDAQAPPA
jgi:hypothetical protein